MGVSLPIQSKLFGQPEDLLGLLIVILSSCGILYRASGTHRKHCSSRFAKGFEWADFFGPYLPYGSRS